MSETASIIDRLGNVIMGVRHSVYAARQGRDAPTMDGWIGRDAYMQFLHDVRPMLVNMTAPSMAVGEFEFMAVKFKRDMAMEPRSIVICVGGAPVRRLALDFPEYDKTPVVDHPSALALEIMALRYFERGERSIRDDLSMPPIVPSIDLISRLPKDGEQPKMHTVSIERLVELGLVFKEKRERLTVVGLTLMGREALRQYEASH